MRSAHENHAAQTACNINDVDGPDSTNLIGSTAFVLEIFIRYANCVQF